MDFPIIDLMDEDACYAELIRWLHPDVLVCRKRTVLPGGAAELVATATPPTPRMTAAGLTSRLVIEPLGSTRR